MTCKGGHEILPKDSEVVFVKGTGEILMEEVDGFPFCGSEHVRTYAQQRGLDFEGHLKESGMTADQTERFRRVRQAWRDLEMAAEQAKFANNGARSELPLSPSHTP
jgi:hypothetical protein